MEFKAEKTERLDKFLTENLKQFSRSQLQRIIKKEVVTVNGNLVVKPSFEIREGDRLIIKEEILQENQSKATLEPEPNIPLNVVYEDKDIVVVNKPAGLLTHPTVSQPNHTLVNALIAKYPDIVKVGENPLRPGIVHRLDKDTSGLLVVAKNKKAFEFLKSQFLKRLVSKKYLALVEGVPKEKEGAIEYDIRPSTQNRLKKVAIKQPFDKLKARKSTRAAKTLYKVKEAFDGKFSLLEVIPLTGRTHQIRVHLSAIGHPVVGDRLYGSKSKISARQFLHAYSLKFTAPNGTPLAFEAELPKDLKEVLEKL